MWHLAPTLYWQEAICADKFNNLLVSSDLVGACDMITAGVIGIVVIWGLGVHRV